MTPASVCTAVGLDATGRTELNWFEVIGPLIGVLVGLVALVTGIVLVRLRPRPQPRGGPRRGARARRRSSRLPLRRRSTSSRFQVRNSRSTGTRSSGLVQPGRYLGTASASTAPGAARAQARAAATETG